MVTLCAWVSFHVFVKYRKVNSIGPSELSITHPDAVKAIYSNASPVTKGPWYTLLDPRVSLSFSRDKQVHARRRKVWDQGFSTKGGFTDKAITI